MSRLGDGAGDLAVDRPGRRAVSGAAGQRPDVEHADEDPGHTEEGAGRFLAIHDTWCTERPGRGGAVATVPGTPSGPRSGGRGEVTRACGPRRDVP